MSENWITFEEAERQTKFRYAKAKEDAKAGITMDDAYNAKLLADSAKNAPGIISIMIEKARISAKHWKRKSENLRMSDSAYYDQILADSSKKAQGKK